jgi:hypothetical protein
VKVCFIAIAEAKCEIYEQPGDAQGRALADNNAREREYLDCCLPNRAVDSCAVADNVAVSGNDD